MNARSATLADTWISLTYAIRAVERNRALSIVKSRGAAHSNQVREQSERDSDSMRHDRDVRRARGEDARADRDGPPTGGPGRGDES